MTVCSVVVVGVRAGWWEMDFLFGGLVEMD